MGSSSGAGNTANPFSSADSGNTGFQGGSSNNTTFSLPEVEATPAQYQAASYGQGNIANQLASGYQQVFGRAGDAEGLNYWANRLGGQNLSQGDVNRYLLGGATGTDVAGGADYALSLTGGRPSPNRAFFQPIYSPSYQNMAMNRGFYSPGYGPFGGGGGFYNPFSYTPPIPFGARFGVGQGNMRPATTVSNPTTTATTNNTNIGGGGDNTTTRVNTPVAGIGGGSGFTLPQTGSTMPVSIAEAMPNIAQPYAPDMRAAMAEYAAGGDVEDEGIAALRYK